MSRYTLADVRITYEPNDYSSIATATLTVHGLETFQLVANPNWNDRTRWFDCVPYYDGRRYDSFEVLADRPFSEWANMLKRHARDEANHFASVGGCV